MRRSRPPRKLPPPEHGIRVTKIGSTWWGERWVLGLARFGSSYVMRLRRGWSYAQQGRVHDLTVERGVVRAAVTGTRPQPYRVTLSLKPFPAGVWQAAIRAMAGKARFAAQLLGGEMPREIDEAFRAAGASLFPARRGDLRTKCSCPDSANPCKHIAALHYLLGEALDRDPFLLFELRGRSKEAVLRALRELRAAAGDARRTPETSAVRPGADAPVATAYEAFRQPVDTLRFRITAPPVEGAVLRHLGAPPAWGLDDGLADLLSPAVSRAGRLARELGLGAAGEAGAPAGSR
jgi:uncharacterized Zn finger protein